MTNASGLTGAQAMQRINHLKQAGDNTPEMAMTLSRLAQFEMSAGMMKRRQIELSEELEKTTADLFRAEGSMGALQQMILDLDAVNQARADKAKADAAAAAAVHTRGGVVVDGPGRKTKKAEPDPGAPAES